MKKSRKSDYIILALICLIVLNMGSMLIGYYTSNKQNSSIEKRDFIFVGVPLNSVKKVINLDSFFEKTINSLFPIAEMFHENKEDIDPLVVVPEYEEVDEREDNNERDIIIENLEEYESLIIIKDSDGVQTVENIPEPLMLNKIKIDKGKPYILMYHTHATESFSNTEKENFHTSLREYNVVGLGDIMTTVLEANNHKVDHVDIYHDLPSYNQSYSRSLNTIRKKQEESNNLMVLLDIHRNAVRNDLPNIESIKSKSRIDIDGKSVATFSLVIGPDSANKEQVLSFAKYIKAVSDTIYPGLCTGIIIKPIGKYNQYLSDFSALIEMGYHFNTVEEAKEGAKYVGEVLSIALNSIIEE